MALHLIILGMKTLFDWSLRCRFKETSSWHSSGHANPNSLWYFYGTLRMLFGPYLDYLNPNLGFPLNHGSINPNHVQHFLCGLIILISFDSPSFHYVLILLLGQASPNIPLFMIIHVGFLVLIHFILCLCPLVLAQVHALLFHMAILMPSPRSCLA